MSEWYEVKSDESIVISSDGNTVEILFDANENGNCYVEVPIALIDKKREGVKFPQVNLEAMKDYEDRCSKAIMELTKLMNQHNYASVYAEHERLRGKIEGVKLARDYAKEMLTGSLEAS